MDYFEHATESRYAFSSDEENAVDAIVAGEKLVKAYVPCDLQSFLAYSYDSVESVPFFCHLHTFKSMFAGEFEIVFGVVMKG
jgi:hypothetical protein